MNTSKPQLDRIDLTTNSRNTLAALIKLLAPHVPYSLQILGILLNTGPRTDTLQDIDPSQVSLWSTIPLHSDAISITDSPALFSIVVFSHVIHTFCIFCSVQSNTPSDPPTKAEKTHIKDVFESLRVIASKARPMYDSVVTANLTHCTDTDPPMIAAGAFQPKWVEVLAPTSTWTGVRYVFPPGAFTRDGLRTTNEPGVEFEVSEIRASDLPFVHSASSVPRTDAYLLSRAPCSVCLRIREDTMVGADGGRPAACALMHFDGSIGALRVDSKHQRQGLGRLVVHALAEKLDFSLKDQGDLELVLDDYHDLGGGALGWNWMDSEASNEAGNRFLNSMVGKECLMRWTYQWMFIPIDIL
ncbi:hypothetical protein OG21DRAFT_1507435 [Imleria badia]|nr:hypothetical protein OG21DRAFT_1507435 [Imleria badia]